jgi:hypothetical protein
MRFNPFSKKDDSKSKGPSKIEVNDPSKDMKPDFYLEIQKKKKELMPNSMTREEILKEIEKQFIKQQGTNDNPFKTKDDVYYCFYNANMELSRPPVPFEEITIATKKYYIHKKFQGGKVSIEELYAAPDIEIDLKGEYDKKETTKAQLEKINKFILYIKDRISKGEEQYNLIDINDLKEEKLRLERILSSIKYGKSAIFLFQNPINLKPAYMMKYSNGEFKYLKVTENNYITEENSVKSIKGQTILKKIEDIINLRITKSWREILMSLIAAIIVIGILVVLWKAAFFEHDMFLEEVKTYCGDIIENYKKEVISMRDFKCSLPAESFLNTQQGFNVTK